MSAQRLSALFPLCKFRSVAKLKLNCLFWHVCLEFLLDEYMGLGFLFNFLKTPWKSLSLFLLYPALQPSKKPVRLIFDPYFCFLFSQKIPSQI